MLLGSEVSEVRLVSHWTWGSSHDITDKACKSHGGERGHPFDSLLEFPGQLKKKSLPSGSLL